jgi:serine protease Do
MNGPTSHPDTGGPRAPGARACRPATTARARRARERRGVRAAWCRLLGCAVGAVAMLATACTEGKQATGAPPATSPSPAGLARPATVPPGGRVGPGTTGAAAFSVPDLVERVRPSVVRVRVTVLGPFGQQAQSTGTGFVVDERGYIVTNNHVVTAGTGRPADVIDIDLADGRSLRARVVGRDPLTDLAVLKVEAGTLPALAFADPHGIRVGEDVVAVGFALNLGAHPTVTKGVVSALDRVIDERLDDGTPISISGAIQTDAAINPGNSGGPLLNMEGAVLGVNTAGLRGAGGTPIEGISFAVSGQVAEPIVRALIETGRVRRGYLGVSVAPVDAAVARARGVPVREGVVIVQVVSGGTADRAGLRPGDVLVKIGDADIKSVGDVTIALTRHDPGERVRIEYYRGTERRTAEITLAERPATAD